MAAGASDETVGTDDPFVAIFPALGGGAAGVVEIGELLTAFCAGVTFAMWITSLGLWAAAVAIWITSLELRGGGIEVFKLAS